MIKLSSEESSKKYDVKEDDNGFNEALRQSLADASSKEYDVEKDDKRFEEAFGQSIKSLADHQLRQQQTTLS